MKKIVLGRTGIEVNPIGLELGPIRKLSFAESRAIMDRAIGAGVEFFDLGLPDRETQKRIGNAISGRRQDLILAGSFIPSDKKKLEEDLKWMLRDLKTEYIDLIQIHDPDYILRPGEESGLFDLLMDAKNNGYVKHIGITTGDPKMAMDCLEYGWYDTIQYPWYRGSEEEEMMVLECCSEAEVGSINVPIDEFTIEQQQDLIRFLRPYKNHLILQPLSDEIITEVVAKVLN